MKNQKKKKIKMVIRLCVFVHSSTHSCLTAWHVDEICQFYPSLLIEYDKLKKTFDLHQSWGDGDFTFNLILTSLTVFLFQFSFKHEF